MFEHQKLESSGFQRGRFYALCERFCDLTDLGAISVSKGAISAGENILKF